MVFSGIYPLDPGGFLKLEEAIRRLTLTDRSVTVNRESSSFLGQGFRLGFNGSLHMDVFRQRLEDEFDEEVIVTRPLVPVKRTCDASCICPTISLYFHAVVFKDGREHTIDNPADFPDPSSQNKVAEILEPMIRATIVTPDECVAAKAFRAECGSRRRLAGIPARSSTFARFVSLLAGVSSNPTSVVDVRACSPPAASLSRTTTSRPVPPSPLRPIPMPPSRPP